MKRIEEIDTNFKIDSNLNKTDIKFYDAEEEPFNIYGLIKEGGKFRRMPERIAQSVSEGVYYGHTGAAGGRIRFQTDSPYIAIRSKMYNVGKMPHFALTGSAGFDIYIKNMYKGTFAPPYQLEDEFEALVELGDCKMKEITINFPLYSGVEKLHIGLSDKAKIEPSKPYKTEKPMVFYGSSITQGGCASRPGNSYQAILSREFDIDYINLGFSGSAKAEDAIIDYIKKLDMSVFVYDYDHNAPDTAHLLNTHEKMFKEIRAENPDIPIIIMPRPKYYLTPDEKQRLNIIKTTYDNAVAAGDKNVYFISGRQLMSMAKNEGTVDNCHPNDLGFASMARALIKLIKKHNILK